MQMVWIRLLAPKSPSFTFPEESLRMLAPGGTKQNELRVFQRGLTRTVNILRGVLSECGAVTKCMCQHFNWMNHRRGKVNFSSKCSVKVYLLAVFTPTPHWLNSTHPLLTLEKGLVGLRIQDIKYRSNPKHQSPPTSSFFSNFPTCSCVYTVPFRRSTCLIGG